MIYWPDTNVFIEAKNRYYAFQMVPQFWSFLSGKMEDGVIRCPRIVYGELLKYQDDLAKWARTRKKWMSLSSNDAVDKNYSDIADHVYATYSRPKADEFLGGADGWVIAYVMHFGGTVVTQESTSRKKKVRIPIICEQPQFNVRWIDTFKMLEELGFKAT